MANNKNIIDQLPKINVSNAGDYLSNLINAYNNYRAGREERRDNFRQGVQKAADNIYQNLPENVQSGLNTAGNYLDKATGVGSITEYLERMDDYMRNQIVSPAANYADKIYGKIMEQYQPENKDPARKGITDTKEPMRSKKEKGADNSDYYANISNEMNNQTIASQPKQKMMRAADNTGGEGGDVPEVASSEAESKPLTIEKYEDSIWGKLQEQKQSIVDAYDANVNYAEEMKKSAYQQAEDAYRVAAREAQGNYEANKPTYGLAAEQLYKTGLTGGGYSDYLAGKAVEARTEELNAARSQQAAAQIAADNNYAENMYNALSNKISGENAYLEAEKEYLAAYNTEINNAIANIMDGLWDASVAEAYLNRYAPGGAIDDETRAMIQQAMTNYNKATYNSVTSALLEYLNAELKAGNPVSEESVRRWLVDNAPGITDDQINAYLSGYFKDGRLNTELVLGQTQGGGTTTNPNNPGSGTGNQGGSGQTGTGNSGSTAGNSGITGNNSGSTGGSTGNNYTAGEVIAGAGMGFWDWLKNLFGGNKNNQSSNDQTGLEDDVNSGKAFGYNETLDIMSSEISNHRAKDVENYQQILTDLANEAFDQNAAAQIRNMANGYVVSSGKFESNKGARTNFQNGDNFSVTIGGQSYRVESQGLAGDRAREAAKDLPDGVVFGYGSELYIKVGSTAYKIGPRPGVGNGDYDLLWRTVYLEQISNMKAGLNGVTNEGANTDTLSATEKVQNWARNIQNNIDQAKNNALTEAERIQKEMIDKFTPNTGITDTLGEAIENNKAEKEQVESTPPYSDPGGNPYQDALENPGVNLDEYPEVNKDIIDELFKEETAWDKLVKWFANIGNAVQKTEQQWANDMQNGIDNALATFGSWADPLRSLRLGAKAFGDKDENRFEKPQEITRGVANLERNGMFDRGLKKGDNFTVEVAGKSYRVESKGEITNEDFINAANNAGVHNGEVFLYGTNICIKQNDKYYEVGSRFLQGMQDDELGLAILGNKDNVANENYENVSQQAVYLSKKPRNGIDSMDKLDLEDMNGNKYKLQVRAILGSDSAAYKAGNIVSNGEAYIHGNDIYVKYGENAYKLAAVGGGKNEDYNKLVDVLRINQELNIHKSASVVVDETIRIGDGLQKHKNYTTDKDGNIHLKSDDLYFAIGNDIYSLSVVNTTSAGAYREGRAKGMSAGEIYMWNDSLYMFLGDKAAKLGSKDYGPGYKGKTYKDLEEYVTNYDPDAVKDTAEEENFTTEAEEAKGWDKIVNWYNQAQANQQAAKELRQAQREANQAYRQSQREANQAERQANRAERQAEREANQTERQAQREANQAERQENWNNFVKGIEDGYNEAGDNMQNGIDNALAALTTWANSLKPADQKELESKTGFLEALKNVRLGNKAFGDKDEEINDYIDSLPKEIGRGVANYERDGMFDRNLKKGDNFTVEVAGKSYKVESKGEVNDEELISAANDAGIHNGEVFTYGQGTYLKQGDKFYEVGQRALMPNQDEALRIAINNNSENVVTDDSYQSMSDQDVYLSGDPRRGFKTMDKIDLSDGNGNGYKLQIRAVLGEDSAAYRAGAYVDNGEAYIHGNDIYVKYGNNAYKLAAVGGNKNGDYDRLAEVLWQKNHYSDSAFGGFKGASVTTDAKTNIPGSGRHINYKVDKDGNIKHNSINDVINVFIDDTGYAMESSGITTTGAYRAGQSKGAEVGEIYAWNGQLYMYLGNGALQLKPREGVGGSALGYEELLQYIEDISNPNAN